MTHIYVDNCEKLNAKNYAHKFLSICRDNCFIIAVIVGVIFGIVAGLYLRQYDLSHDTLVLIEYPGELFLRSLELLILPFIITCIITGTANLNIRENKQIAVYTILIFFSLALFNVALGMCFGMLVPTSPLDVTEEFTVRPEENNLMDGFLDLGRNIIPTNLFQATFSNTFTRVDYYTNENTGETTIKKHLDYRQSTNMMGLLVFCTAFGFVLGTMDEKKQVLLDFFSVLYEATQKLLVGAIWFTPVGTASIVCSKIAAIPQLSETINQLSFFFFLITGGLLMYAVIILPALLLVITKRNPYKYFLALMPAIICSFSTATKSTVVPMAMQLLQEKTDADKKVTKFVLPIGIINLNGTAFFLGFSIVFLAHRYGIDFSGSDIISLWLGCTFLSMSGASIPSASIVLLITLCGTAGIPPENVGILIALDWILDRIRTVNNLLGDVFTVAVVQHISRDHLAEKPSAKEKKSVNGKSEDRMQHENLQIHRDSPIITKTEIIV